MILSLSESTIFGVLQFKLSISLLCNLLGNIKKMKKKKKKKKKMNIGHLEISNLLNFKIRRLLFNANFHSISAFEMLNDNIGY